MEEFIHKALLYFLFNWIQIIHYCLYLFKYEDCDTEYTRNCHVEYENKVTQIPVQICNEELKRDCDIEGETVCTKEYETGENSF